MSQSARVLVLGASYGLLPALRLIQAGHAVTIVGRTDEVDAIRDLGITVHGTASEPQHVPPGATLDAVIPEFARPENHDLIFLVIAPPHLRAPPLEALLHRMAVSGRPIVSLLNEPLTAYLRRLAPDWLPDMWQDEPPALSALPSSRVTSASADPQAVRIDPAQPTHLHVSLPTNLKIAAFHRRQDQRLLQRVVEPVDRPGRLVRLRATSSRWTAVSKWPMLVVGNLGSLTPSGPVPIRHAVLNDAPSSRAAYEELVGLCIRLGAPPNLMVPFDRYAPATRDLAHPSSWARTAQRSPQDTPRFDRFLARIARRLNHTTPHLDRTTRRLDALLGAS